MVYSLSFLASRMSFLALSFFRQAPWIGETISVKARFSC